MIVVSNTSPLTNLAAIGQFNLLRRLYDKVYIAHGVWEELNAGGKRWSGCVEVAQASWIERLVVQNQDLVTALRRDLDRGEAETIALALQLGADLVLLDEQEGRHAAQWMGLQVVGVVGILLEAKAAGAIHTIHPHLNTLRQSAGFDLDTSPCQHALAAANESAEVRRRINDLAPGGGYVLAPRWAVRPEVPPENLYAIYEAVEEYS